jgi:hypothetical protein
MGTINLIHPNNEVKNGVLHLIGNVKGCDLEKIIEIWNGNIYVDKLVGIYHHPKNFHLKIGKNNGTITGDASNANICYKSRKKLRKDKKLALRNLNWQ